MKHTKGKRCSKCKNVKSIGLFGVKKFNKDGLNHYCKECENKRGKLKYANPEEKERKKYYQILKLYGLTKEEYLKKLENQKFKCVLCEEKLFNDKYTHIDHCHTTGKVRDILCNRCNNLLGDVKEDVDFLNKLIKYIDKHNGKFR